MTHITQRALALFANSRVDMSSLPMNRAACNGEECQPGRAVTRNHAEAGIQFREEELHVARVTCPGCRIRIDAALEGNVIGPEVAA